MRMIPGPLVALFAVAGLLAGCAPGRSQGVASDVPGAPVVLPPSVEADWRGKVVVADFWATWCQPCLASSPNVQILHDRFAADPGVLVVGVHSDDGNGDPAAYVAEHGYTYPLVEKGQAVAEAFGVHALPTFVVLDQEGREVFRHVGMLGERKREEIAEKVAALRG